MKNHLGKLIEKRLHEIGISKSEFARRINKSRQNVNHIFGRRSVDSDLLKNISDVLRYDFFQLYRDADFTASESMGGYKGAARQSAAKN